MSDYNVIIRRPDDEGSYEVWLDAATGKEPDANAMVLGVGDTRDAALESARAEVLHALNVIDRARDRRVEVLP